jgi:triosephosphate isomerase
MRNQIVAGNWKMNNDQEATAALLTALEDLSSPVGSRVMVAPPFVHLAQSVAHLKDSTLTVAAQNMHAAVSGAYTGEVAGSMLKSIGVHTVILGHSERRTYFAETNELLAEKVNSALDQGFEVIFCFGEQLQERQEGKHFEVVEEQLRKALFAQGEEQWDKIILAYEPVWAIGTGETASPEQAQEMHHFIRNLLQEQYGDSVAENTSILYGGSVKPDNAKEIFSKPDVDGGLIGGASLKAADFKAIVNAL